MSSRGRPAGPPLLTPAAVVGGILVLLALSGATTPFSSTSSKVGGSGALSGPSPGPELSGPRGGPVAVAHPSGAPSLPAWTNLSSSAGLTTYRCCAAIAYDAADGYTVLFGGHGACGEYCNDTWIFNGTTWKELVTKQAPSGRQFSSMAYDPFDREVILFGGIGADGVTPLSDTWAFSAGQWHQIPTVGTPPGRWAAGLAPDPTDGYVLLFGGYAGGSQFLNDSWGFSGGNWIALDPARAPPARWTPSMSFDPAEGGVLLFGGFSGSLGFLADTWVYSSGEWKQLPTHLYPPPREKAMLDDDPLWGGAVLFGGDSCPVGCTTEVPNHLFNDTYLFAGGMWTNETQALGPNPGAQCCGVMAYDWDRGTMVLVGARAPADLNGSVWSLSVPPGPSGLQVHNVQAFPQNVTQGNYLTIVVTAAPGKGSLHFSYQGLPVGCTTADSAWLSCPATQLGHYTVAVTVTNTSGGTQTVTASFFVSPEVPAVSVPPAVPTWVPWVAGAMVAAAVLLVLLWNFRFRRSGSDKPTKASTPGQGERTSEPSEKAVDGPPTSEVRDEPPPERPDRAAATPPNS